MRFGFWLPVFGGWLRNVADEGMEAQVGRAVGQLIEVQHLNDVRVPQ